MASASCSVRSRSVGRGRVRNAIPAAMTTAAAMPVAATAQRRSVPAGPAGVEPVVFRHAAGDVAAGRELLAERLEMRVAGQLFEFGRLALVQRAV